jgi:hypothetical protein
MNAESHRDARRQERDAWCATRKLGQEKAVFFPGDEVRCPATKTLSGGQQVVCGTSLRLWVKPRQQVVVRKTQVARQGSAAASLDAFCHGCQNTLEVFPILEATG